LSGFLLSVFPQAVPARCTPAFRLSLVRSCHGGTSLESHSGLQLTIRLSRNTGKKYADHAATLRIWAKRQKAEKKTPGIPDYTFAEGESL
jgi:hypothetical protein